VKVPRPPPAHARAPASEERAFRFQSGATARSLEEFARAVASEPAAVVNYHRHHYAPWLRDVVGDAPLARRVEAFAEESSAPDAFRDIVAALAQRRLEELDRATEARSE
jgi:hypothetical protein